MNPNAYQAKLISMRNVLDIIIKNGEVSRNSIATALGLSTATVTNIVTELMKMDLLYEGRQENAAVGRKTTLISFNAEYCRVVAVSLAETDRCDISVCNLFGESIRAEVIPFDLTVTERRSEVFVLRELIALIRMFIETLPEALRGTVSAVSICVGGMVNAHRTIDIPKANWKNVNLAMPLQAAVGLPVYVEGITRMKALYEMRFIEPEEKNVIYLNLSTGIGIVNIFSGKVIYGKTGIAGEAGHVSLDIHGPPCYCGNRGCFELYCGMTMILMRAAKLLGENNRSDVFYDLIVNKNEPLTPETLFKAHDSGSLVIHELFCEVAEYLGVGIAMLSNLFDPDRLIISGYLDGRDSFILDNAKAEARSRIVNRFSRDIPITRAHLRNDDIHLAISAFALKKLLDTMLQ